MSKIKTGGLDQYGAGPFEQQQCGTAGVEGVKPVVMMMMILNVRSLCSKTPTTTKSFLVAEDRRP